MGGFEPKAKPWNVDPIPDGFEFQLLPEDWDQFEILMKNAIHRTPCLETAEVKLLLNGPGELHARRQLHPRRSAGARRLFRLRRLQLGGHRQRRRRGQARRRVDRRRRGAARPVGRRHPPLRAVPRQPPAPRRPHGRDARPALRDALAARGARRRCGRCAARRSTTGCAAKRRGVRQQDELGARELLPAAGRAPSRRTRSARPAGCRTCSRSSARAARTSSCSTRRRSRNSCSRAATRSPCCSGCARTRSTCPSARMVYTAMLNARGGFESDLTIVRARAATSSSSSPARRRRRATSRGSSAHIARRRARGAGRRHQRVFGDLGDGPEGRGAARPRVAGRPVARPACRSRTTAEIDVGYARVRAARMSYVGGPGYELYVPTDQCVTLYDALWSAGARVRPAGRRLLHDRRAAHRGRPPRVGRGAVARRDAVGGGPRLRREDGQAGARSSAATRCCAQRAAGITEAPRHVHVRRSRARSRGAASRS